MSLERIETPGLATLAVHFLVVVLLLAVLAMLWPFRAVTALVAEGLIRVTDSVSDMLTERLNA